MEYIVFNSQEFDVFRLTGKTLYRNTFFSLNADIAIAYTFSLIICKILFVFHECFLQ